MVTGIHAREVGPFVQVDDCIHRLPALHSERRHRHEMRVRIASQIGRPTEKEPELKPYCGWAVLDYKNRRYFLWTLRISSLKSQIGSASQFKHSSPRDVNHSNIS